MNLRGWKRVEAGLGTVEKRKRRNSNPGSSIP
jgi:hypothetical protein